MKANFDNYSETKAMGSTIPINQTALKAQNIFLDLIPASWSVQKNRFDDGIDYDISSGTMFAVNIKGTAKPKYCDNDVNCFMETSKLEYYSKKVTKPIFIVLVDIVTEKAYWLFIQEYIENTLEEKHPNWRSKKTVSVKIPLTNTLNDFSKLNATILRATNLLVLFQYKLPFLTVSASIQHAENKPQLLSTLHNSCSSNSCSSTACSCSSSDEATPYRDYLTTGEKHYHEYVSSLNQQEQSSCFTALHNLTNTILNAIDEEEYFVASALTLRLADIYFFAFTTLSKTVGANKAFSLLDSGEILLEKAHNLVTRLETPNKVLLN